MNCLVPVAAGSRLLQPDRSNLLCAKTAASQRGARRHPSNIFEKEPWQLRERHVRKRVRTDTGRSLRRGEEGGRDGCGDLWLEVHSWKEALRAIAEGMQPTGGPRQVGTC